MMFTTILPATVTTTYSTTAPISARMPQVNGGTPLNHPTAAMAKNPKTAIVTDSRRTSALVCCKAPTRVRRCFGSASRRLSQSACSHDQFPMSRPKPNLQVSSANVSALADGA